MKHRIMLAAAVLACGFGAAQAAPLEVYGKLPVMDDVTISPDGTKIAFVQPVDGKQAVVVDQISPAAVIANMPGSAQKVRSLIWADPTHVLVLRSQSGFAQEVESGRSEWYLVQMLDLVKRKASLLLTQDLDVGPTSKFRGPDKMNVVVGEPEARQVNGRPTVFVRGVTFSDNQGVPTLFAVDLASNRQTVIDKAMNGGQDRDWIVDSQGNLLAQITYDELSHQMTVRLKGSAGWVPVYAKEALNDPPSVMGLSPDGGSLVLEITRNGEVAYRPLSLADGKLGQPLTQYDGLSRLIEDPATHRIIGGKRMALEPDYVFFDPKDQAAWNGLVASFKGEDVELVSWSDDRSKVVVKVTGMAHGVVYAFVDLAARKASLIGQAYDGLKADDLAEVHIATYKAADGRPIKAFLTLPNGREPKGLPMIVLPHGGPAARDAAGFDWWSQALASRGYAVLQPQFRGSSGFGYELEQAGYGEWGRKMQTDLSDGVRALAAKGYIDPKRVCIVGGSYGGYAALAGVTLEHGVYRCAVSVAGVSDLRKMIGGRDADVSHNSAVRYWKRFMGAKDMDDPVFDQFAPLKHADAADAPILLIHGRDDSVVPIEQSEKMSDALKAAKKPVEFVILQNEDHWLSREDTRLQMLQATVKFLEANNPPG